MTKNGKKRQQKREPSKKAGNFEKKLNKRKTQKPRGVEKSSN